MSQRLNNDLAPPSLESSGFERFDIVATAWMAQRSVMFLRVTLGLVFLWFGALKYFPDLSPAQDLATRTISLLSFGMLEPPLSIYILATWECLIGLGLIFSVFLRATLFLLFSQMLGAASPLLLFPSEVFTRFPYAPTLEGQYIIKNIVFVSAALAVGATVRGGAVVADPEAARLGKMRDSRAEERAVDASA